MRFLIFIIVLLAIHSCKTTYKEIDAKLYLSNISMPPYDSVRFRIEINNKIVVDDSINNEYISSQWENYTVKIPGEKFRINAEVTGKNFRINKDTIINPVDSLKLFYRFYFIPFKNIYNDPIIYTHIHKDSLITDAQIKQIADSLYKLKLLSPEYIKDSVPSSTNIELFIK